MKLRSCLALPLALLFALTSCGSDSSTDHPDRKAAAASSTETTSSPHKPAGSDVSDSFAEELHVNLDEMTRTSSGLYYEDLEVGRGLGARPGHTVVVHYTGWLPNGMKFDSSRDAGRGPFTFPLGSGRVIAGWDEGVAGMKLHGRRKLVIPPNLAYGSRGAGGVIPPNATLVFEVELLEIKM